MKLTLFTLSFTFPCLSLRSEWIMGKIRCEIKIQTVSELCIFNVKIVDMNEKWTRRDMEKYGYENSKHCEGGKCSVHWWWKILIKTRRIKGLLVSFLSDGSQDSRLVEATACHLKEKRKKNAPRKAVHAYEIDDATESKPKPKSLFDSIPLIKGHTASLQREFSRGLFMVAP